MGQYKSGKKRYEIRHFNDLKIAHPDSLAAPAVRPKLGRPKTTVQLDAPEDTDVGDGETPHSFQNQFPEPTTNKSKQPTGRANVGKLPVNNHETSNSANQAPASGSGGGSAKRPIRATRNPNPQYVDAIEWYPHPWSASKNEIADLNRHIQSFRGPKP